MGITAAQLVWEPEQDENDTTNTWAASSGGVPLHDPAIGGEENDSQSDARKRPRQTSTQRGDDKTD